MNPRTKVLLVMSACFGCVALDNTKLVTALPTIFRQTGASPNMLRWLVEASLLVYASLLLLGGSLSERFGARSMLLVGLGLFGGASLAGAECTSLLGLIAARAVLGAGAACITPATLATLKHTFPAEARPRAFAVWTASYGVGAAIGPVLAGTLLSRAGVGSVLLSNLPLALLCAAGTWRWVPPNLPRRPVPLDWLGALLCLLPAACLLFAILSGPVRGWLTPEVTLAASAAVGSGLLAWLWLRRAPNPLLDPGLFALARFSRALWLSLLGYFAFSGISFVVAQYLQLVRERSAFTSGLLNLPLPASLLLGTLFSPRWIARFGAERALLYSLGVAWAGAVLLTCAGMRAGQASFCLALVPFGAGSGAAFATATELSLGSVSPERAASAAAVSESAFELGGVLGVATLSTLLASDALSHESVLAHAPRALGAGAAALFLALLVAGKFPNAHSPSPPIRARGRS